MLVDIVEDLRKYVEEQYGKELNLTDENPDNIMDVSYALDGEFVVERANIDLWIHLKFNGCINAYCTCSYNDSYPNDNEKAVVESIINFAKQLLEKDGKYKSSFGLEDSSIEIMVEGLREDIMPEINKIRELYGEPDETIETYHLN